MIPQTPSLSQGAAIPALDPRTRLLALFALGLLSVVLDSERSLSMLLFAGALAFLRAARGSRARVTALLVVSLAVASTVLTQALFYGGVPRTALLTIGPVSLWQEGVRHGLVQSERLAALGLLGTALAASTPPDRLVLGLVSLGVPGSLAFLSASALRAVPTAAAEWQTARTARARRAGSRLRAPWTWLAQEASLLAPVCARSVRRARTLAETLESRGFHPLSAYTSRRPLAMGAHDRLLLAAIGLLLVACYSVEILFQLYLYGVLYVPSLRPLYAFARIWL